jgi:hypothetical protein
MRHIDSVLAFSALSLFVGLAACGGSVVVGGGTGGSAGAGGAGEGGAGEGGAAGAGGAAGSGGATGGAGGSLPEPLPEGFCNETCAAPLADGCFSVEACAGFCEAGAPSWTAEVGAAFATCVAEHALCFETASGCMLSELHGFDSTHPLHVDGAGFAANEGDAVHVWGNSVPSFEAEGAIAGGSFAFDWVEPLVPTDYPSVVAFVFIDANGDGVCSPALDVVGAAQLEWNGDFVEPAYSFTFTPELFATPTIDLDYVCSIAP